MRKKLTVILLSISAVMLLVNAGFRSEEGEEKPAINFYGKLKPIGGPIQKIENILISGTYENIPFYGIPADSTADPKSNTTEIDLSQLKELKLTKFDKMGKGIKKFNNREYIEVTVTFEKKKEAAQPTDLTDGLWYVEKNYLVERSRKVLCDIVEVADTPLNKELRFEAIEKISIEGYKAREASPRKKAVKMSAAQAALCASAKKNFEEIMKKSNGDPRLKKLQLQVSNICSVRSAG